MKKLLRLAVGLSIMVLLSQCAKQDMAKSIPQEDSNTPSPITANLQGNILDENGQPARGVSVQVGSQTTFTDGKGFFKISAASLDKHASLLIANKSGYFTSFKSFCATPATNYLRIQLIPKQLIATINAANGGTATLSDGSSITLPANGVVIKATGASYTGNIKVFAAAIDPTSPNIGLTVPGSFMATNAQGKRVSLASYGMLAVELQSPDGTPLQIADGYKATLNFAVPSSLKSKAPSTIPLWFINEKTGLWQEQGNATLTNGIYTGQVSHFSFWNCDDAFPSILLSFTLTGSNGNPLPYTVIKLISTNAGTSYAFTDNLGHVSGMVPAGETLLMEVSSYQCTNAFYTSTIGPFATDIDLGNINVGTTPAITTLTGNVVNCSSQPITKGGVLVAYDNNSYYAPVDATGNFSLNLTACTGSTNMSEVAAIDSTTAQIGNSVIVALNGSSVNMGTLIACGGTNYQFYNYTVDGNPFTISSTGVYADSSFKGIAAAGTITLWGKLKPGSPISEISFNFDDMGAPGPAPLNSITVDGNTETNFDQPRQVTLSKYAALVGQYYEGSYAGTYTDNNSIVHPISCTFRVMRTQ